MTRSTGMRATCMLASHISAAAAVESASPPSMYCSVVLQKLLADGHAPPSSSLGASVTETHAPLPLLRSLADPGNRWLHGSGYGQVVRSESKLALRTGRAGLPIEAACHVSATLKPARSPVLSTPLRGSRLAAAASSPAPSRPQQHPPFPIKSATTDLTC